MNLGDLHWVEFPGGAGRAQAGRRPAIVFQGISGTARLSTVLMIPLTSQIDALRFPGTVLIEPDSMNGLRLPSVALVFQLTAIDKRFVLGRLGTLAKGAIDKLLDALHQLLDRTDDPRSV